MAGIFSIYIHDWKHKEMKIHNITATNILYLCFCIQLINTVPPWLILILLLLICFSYFLKNQLIELDMPFSLTFYSWMNNSFDVHGIRRYLVSL